MTEEVNLSRPYYSTSQPSVQSPDAWLLPWMLEEEPKFAAFDETVQLEIISLLRSHGAETWESFETFLEDFTCYWVENYIADLKAFQNASGRNGRPVAGREGAKARWMQEFVVSPVKPGGRHGYLLKVNGMMRADGLPLADRRDVLEGINQQLPSPLPDREVRSMNARDW